MKPIEDEEDDISWDEEDDIPWYDKDREEFTEEEWDQINEYEYGEEWLDRDPELWHMDIEEYDEMRRIKDYGADDENDCLDNIF